MIFLFNLSLLPYYLLNFNHITHLCKNICKLLHGANENSILIIVTTKNLKHQKLTICTKCSISSYSRNFSWWKKNTEHLHSHSPSVITPLHPHSITPPSHTPWSTPPPLMCTFTTRRTQNNYEHTIIDGEKTLMRKNPVYQDTYIHPSSKVSKKLFVHTKHDKRKFKFQKTCTGKKFLVF